MSAISVWAQPASERTVGPRESGSPLQISVVNGQTFATLVKAAGVAGGFEGLLPVRRRLSILATGKSLREVLDAMVAADPRYEWREDNAVVVFRPIESWSNASSPLRAPIGGLSLDNIDAGDVLGLVAQMLGVKPIYNTADTRRFSVRVGDGETWLEGLNSIARAHGLLTWAIEPAPAPNAHFPLNFVLYVGAHGRGFGIPAGAVLHPKIVEPRGHRQAISTEPSILDRIVGKDRGPEPFLVYGLHNLVPGLADAARVPIGFQSLPAREGAVIVNNGINLTGMRLRDALDVLVTLDPRYQWHELNGVIVFRPVNASSDSQDPLFRLLPSVQLQDVPTAQPIDRVLAALGRAQASGFSDTRQISISLPPGSVVDLLNEISRQHGELSWTWREIPPIEQRQYDREYRYEITFSLPGGGGGGFPVP